MNEPRDFHSSSNQRRSRKKGCLIFGGILVFLCLLVVVIIPFTPAMDLLRKVKRGLIEIVHGKPTRPTSPPAAPSGPGDHSGGEIVVTPPPADPLDPQVNPLSPPLRSLQRRPQAPHAKSKTPFLPLSDPFNGALKRPTQKANS